MNDGKDSNCDDLHLNGLEGTIVKMPENCGPGQYAVARALQVSSNQSIPHHILRKRDSSRPVMDLVFDYDFERVKRADEKIYVRVDYSNAFEYRLDIVADEPVRKRSMETPLSPRFFSPDPEEWRKSMYP
jgi:chitinase